MSTSKSKQSYPTNINNTVWHHATVTRERREHLNGHRSIIVWFTGLSGAGKSTIAHAVEEQLYLLGCRTFVLDGDNIRHGLCDDLSFSKTDRTENIRRIGNVAKLYIEAGLILLTAFISPYKKDRDFVRNLVPHGDFIEVYCKASLETCEQRDVKGLYKKARAGQITEFTGISAPYEPPINPELTIDTSKHSVNESVDIVLSHLKMLSVFKN